VSLWLKTEALFRLPAVAYPRRWVLFACHAVAFLSAVALAEEEAKAGVFRGEKGYQWRGKHG